MISVKQKADSIGAISSALCLVHCVATPFLFVAQSSLFASANGAPNWWKPIDYIFLIISFIAVYRTSQTTSKKWISTSLWISWSLLFVVIINEKLALFSLSESFIYLPAISLIVLHLYNRNYCQCTTKTCCTHEK